MSDIAGRYSPAIRLDAVRAMLSQSRGVSIREIAERLDVSRPTARRYVQALLGAGDPVLQERDGSRKLYRLESRGRRNAISLTASQMLALYLSRSTMAYLEGTGFKEDLDQVFDTLRHTLRQDNYLKVRELDRKFYDVGEAPHLYKDRLDDVSDIIEGLIREERIEARHQAVAEGQDPFRIDPYTLLVYNKGLYLVGFSHRHQALRTFALDGFQQLDWRRGDSFQYPADYHPQQTVAGAFGLFTGDPVPVKLRFSQEVHRFVTRRTWHPSQSFHSQGPHLTMTMHVADTPDLENWVRSFGSTVEVLEPATLRQRVAQDAKRVVAIYEREE